MWVGPGAESAWVPHEEDAQEQERLPTTSLGLTFGELRTVSVISLSKWPIRGTDDRKTGGGCTGA